MQVILERARLADIDLLLELMHAYYEFDHLAFDPAQARQALEQVIQDETLGRLWLINVDSETAGYLVLTLGFSLEYQGRDAFVDEFYIGAGFRGLGLGRQVLALVEQEARRLAVRVLHLEVERKNERAQGFYRKAGYEDHDRYLMTKSLA